LLAWRITFAITFAFRRFERAALKYFHYAYASFRQLLMPFSLPFSLSLHYIGYAATFRHAARCHRRFLPAGFFHFSSTFSISCFIFTLRFHCFHITPLPLAAAAAIDIYFR